MLDDRHHQATFGLSRDAQIDAFVLDDDLPLIIKMSVAFRVLLQGACNRRQDERQERQAGRDGYSSAVCAFK